MKVSLLLYIMNVSWISCDLNGVQTNVRDTDAIAADAIATGAGTCDVAVFYFIRAPTQVLQTEEDGNNEGNGEKNDARVMIIILGYLSLSLCADKLGYVISRGRRCCQFTGTRKFILYIFFIPTYFS